MSFPWPVTVAQLRARFGARRNAEKTKKTRYGARRAAKKSTIVHEEIHKTCARCYEEMLQKKNLVQQMELLVVVFVER